MCRGCFLLTKDGKTTMDEYLKCLDAYNHLIGEFKQLNEMVSDYKETLNGESRRIVDRFHKELILVERDLGAAESKMDFKLKWNTDSMKYEIMRGKP